MAAKLGRVLGIWRYPVKSMQGEMLERVDVTTRGLTGDRAFALLDVETGKVASAKNPRRWPNLFEYRAEIVDTANTVVRITCPGGERLTSAQADVEQRLSAALGRQVRLAAAAPQGAIAEGYWPDESWLSQPGQTFDFPLPPGTFFDGAAVHLLASTTLEQLHKLAPASQFDRARFRPNLVIEPSGTTDGFVENDWLGKTIAIGNVLLRIDCPCPRCIMTTLPQGELPKDTQVLHAAVKHNQSNVGVYASVLRAASVTRDDEVRMAETP